MVAEELEAHQLACAGIDGGAHEGGLENGLPVLDGNSAEEGPEGRGGQEYR